MPFAGRACISWRHPQFSSSQRGHKMPFAGKACIRWHHLRSSRFQRGLLALLCMLLLDDALAAASSGSTLSGILHAPSYDDPNWSPGMPPIGNPIPPELLRIEPLSRDGQQEDTAVKYQSQFQHIGCYEASMAITRDSEQDTNYDPSTCIETCLIRYPDKPKEAIVAAVHGPRCGCVVALGDDYSEVMAEFSESPNYAQDCIFPCKFYDNPICGGPPNFWGVFKVYDSQSLVSNGAYDPWRYIWYTLVVVKETTIKAGDYVDDMDAILAPERYYLHAADTQTGKAAFQYQVRLPGIVTGLKYDLDSTRLVGVLVSERTARLPPRDVQWAYNIFPIDINTTIKSYPNLSWPLTPQPIIASGNIQYDYLPITGASAMYSRNGQDAYIFALLVRRSLLTLSDSKTIIVSVPDGDIMHEASMDFKVTAFFTNEKWGDVTAFGIRYRQTVYVYLARIFYSEFEGRKDVDWRYTGYKGPGLEFLIDPEISENFTVHPGLSASDHLYNKSYMFTRNYSVNYMDPRPPLETGMKLIEIDIRNKSLWKYWCDQDEGCLSTIDPLVPYAGLLNREPRIPLSLAAPSLISARFNMGGNMLIVKFDRATLKGAMPVDDNNDVVPDRIDYTVTHTGEVGCDAIFDDATTALVGPAPDTTCEWTTDGTTVFVYLSIDPEIARVEVGDQLFVRADTVYTVPNIIQNEYSMAANTGIQVSLPDPLTGPVIEVAYKQEVDECSEINMFAGDTYNTGGSPIFNWTLKGYDDLSGNPGQRQFNQTKMLILTTALSNSTQTNSPLFSMHAQDLEPATLFYIELEVTSRWGVTSNRTLLLKKLDFPSPTVLILGNPVETKNRTQKISLLAQGQPSECALDNRLLAYKWSETTGKLNFDDFPDILTDARTLIIPKYTLEPTGTGDELNIYNFTVECYDPGAPQRASTATKTIQIRRSPVYVQLSLEDRKMTRGDIFVMDGREAQDPDYPTASGMTFKGTYKFFCQNPTKGACYEDSGGPDDALELTICKTDINAKMLSGGRSFSRPFLYPSDTVYYCRWARGVLMAATLDFEIGKYTWTIEIEAADGRKAEKSIEVEIVSYKVPQVNLQIIDPKPKYAVTDEIRFAGKIESELGPTDVATFSWQILERGTNPAYNVDDARAAEEAGQPYNIPAQLFLDITDDLNIDNASRFTWKVNQADLTIKKTPPPHTLKESQLYKIQLSTVLNGKDEFATQVSVTLQTAGAPPVDGTFTCEPRNTSMDMPRCLLAEGWTADDQPLSYKFGYLRLDPAGQTQPTPVSFTTEQLPTSTLCRDNLMLGDSSTNYSLTLYVDIITPFDAITTVFLVVQSTPPDDPQGFIEDKLDEAMNADVETALTSLMTVMNVNDAPLAAPGVQPSPADIALAEQVTDILIEKQGNAPITADTAMTQVVLVNQIVDAGVKSPKVMDALENMVQGAAEKGLFRVDNPALMNEGFKAIGSILPGQTSPITAADIPPGGIIPDFMRPGGGRRLQGMPNMFFMEDPNPMLVSQKGSSAFGRQDQNHPRPTKSMVISDCPLAFCDWEFLVCVQKAVGRKVNMFTCCDAANPETLCESPPCWFEGGRCPFAEEDQDAPERRLQRRPPFAGKVGPKDKHVDFDWDWKWSEDLGYSSLFAARRENESSGNTSRNNILSASDLLDLEERRLTTLNFTDQGSEERIMMMEEDETPVLARVQQTILSQERTKELNIRAKARREVLYAQLPPNEARLSRNAADADEAFIRDQVIELERQLSQIITRSSVLRDTICKQAIVQLTSTEPPLRFENAAFVLYMGKTRNLSDARPSLQFPDKFVVPPTAPDEPTPDNPVTAFSFIYVEYKKNIYGWSASSPPGNDSNIITLIVMKASTKELAISNETEPIRVFADVSLYSSALCMYWDRFAPNTAGGAWSTQGIINDGEGCLTTHLSDIAIFIDGRVPATFSVEKAKSYYLEETIDGPENSGTNYLVIVICGFQLLLGTILALAGYIQDELRREAQRAADEEKGDKKGTNNRYHLQGDGVSAPMNVDDAIAYNYIESRSRFLTFTFWKVVMRDHVIIGALFYSQTFSRPQRILCDLVMVSGISALNAVIYGVPNMMVQDDQYIASGIVSGLMIYPLMVLCVFMFAARPTPSRQRIIKRKTDRSEVEAMQSAKLEIEHKSSKMPDLPALPAPTQAPLGSTTLLSLPPPAPLMPPKAPAALALMGPGAATMQPQWAALPPPPPPPGAAPPGVGSQLALPGTSMPRQGLPALPGLPSLPPLPVLKAGPPGSGMQALPPPPKHPSPLMRYSVLRAGLPQPGEGEHPRQEFLAPPPPPPGGATAALADKEQTALPGTFAEDPSHRAYPPDREAEEGAARELTEEAQHGMGPGAGTPPLPPLQGAPSGMATPPGGPGGGFSTPPGGPGGFSTPPGGPGGFSTPPGGPGTFTPQYGLAVPGTPPAPPSSHGSFAPMTPLSTPPAVANVRGISHGIVHRGEPPNTVAPPFPPPSSAMALPNLPPMPMMRPPVGGPPSLPTGFLAPPGMPKLSSAYMPQPPPPPPPAEDDSVFLRRARLIYMERAAKGQQHLQLDEIQEPGWETPQVAYTIMLVCPYLACAVSICCHVFINLTYSMKFQRVAEKHWLYACIIGICLVMVILEMIRAAVMTIVELRKFEIRRRLAGGDFNKSRIRKGADDSTPPLKSKRSQFVNKPKVPTTATAVPKIKPKEKPPLPVGQPPPPGAAMGFPPGFPGQPPGFPGGFPGPPPQRPSFLPNPQGEMAGSRLPVGQPPPPSGPPPAPGQRPGPGSPSAAAKAVPPIRMAGTRTPTGRSPVGTPGARSPIGATGGPSLLPGRMDGTGAGTPTRTGAVQPPPPMMPGGKADESVSSVTKSLSDRMAQSRMATAPPPPGSGSGSRPGSGRGPGPNLGGATRGPPAPTSQPGSGRSGRSGEPPKPPTPPPTGTVQQTRAARRAQQ